MVSSSIMATSSSPDKCRASTSSAFHEDLEIEWSMRNAAIIDHQNEPDQTLSGLVLNAFSPFETATHTDMIHIEVPDSKTLVEKFDGVSKYVGYNLHINGWYHSCVRYSCLYEFSEMVKQKFANRYKGPEFPSKKLFKLDSRAIDDRRVRISKYFQALVQHPEIARYYLVEKKLLGFQVDSFRATSNFVSIDVFKGDGEKLQIKCNVSDSTGEVMKIIAEKLGLESPEQFLWNYGLFMARSRDTATSSYSVSSDSFDPLIVRLFRNFEAPFISLSTSNQKSIADGVFHFICLRKLVWDPRTEEPLMDEPVFLDLLYKQAVQDFKNGHLSEMKDEQYARLKSHMQKDEKSMFLRTCHQIPSYSYEVLEDCSGDFPRNVHVCSIKFGRRQIILSFKDEAGNEQHRVFRATRIRVWRISQIVDDVSFQFEYLMARDTFEWITLHTNQAILMSLLLQSIGAEILYEHNNLTIEQQILKERQSKGMYVEKDETPLLVKDPKKPIIVLKNAIEPADPLGVMEHYRAHTHMLTTISESIPQKNEAFANVSNEDL